MRLLLDTHTLLWFLAGDIRLPAAVRQRVSEPRAEVFVSMASLWEIAIKVSIGKLTLAAPMEVLLPEQFRLQRFTVLPIELPHVFEASRLPLHHRDPFDRLLVAQARVEGLPLVSADTAFHAYDVDVRWDR